MTIARFPISTGEVCEALNVPDWRVHSIVRRRLVRPYQVAGRRLWTQNEIRILATILGVAVPPVLSMREDRP